MEAVKEAKSLTGPTAQPKQNRHVTFALTHIHNRRGALLEKREAIDKELADLDAAIIALDK